jgi:hypothetical protein
MSIKYKLSAVLAVGVLAVPVASFAQSMTMAQIEAELATLTAEVQALEQQVAAQTNAAVAPAPLQATSVTMPATGANNAVSISPVSIMAPTNTSVSASVNTSANIYTPQTSPSVATMASVTPMASTSAPSVTLSLDPTTPTAGQIVMGSTDNILSVIRFTAGARNSEPVNITQLPVADFVSSNTLIAPLSNLTLWNGSTLLGTASPTGGLTTSSTGQYYPYVFNFAVPVQISQGSSLALTLKGDVASLQAGAADDAENVIVATKNFTAVGANPNEPATTIGSAVGNIQTVLRSTLSFAATPLGATYNRGKIPTDQFAALSFSANSAGSIAVNTVAVTLTGSAYSATLLNDPNGVRLLDENNESLGTSTASPVTGGAMFSFNLGATTNGQAISAGQTRTWTLVINDSDLAVAMGQGVVNLSAMINTSAGITYTDGLSTPSTSGLMLSSPVIFPIVLNSVLFAQGL